MDGALTCLFKPSAIYSTLPAASGTATAAQATSIQSTSVQATPVQFFVMPDVNMETPPLRRSSRSSNNSQSDEGPAYVIGAVVFAHKGQSVPYWRLGVAIKIKAKAYTVRFFGDLKEVDCSKSNVMAFEEYPIRKKGQRVALSSSLYQMLAQNFSICVSRMPRKNMLSLKISEGSDKYLVSYEINILYGSPEFITVYINRNNTSISITLLTTFYF